MICTVCLRPIAGPYFNDAAGKAYCSEACFETTLPTCAACQKVVRREYVQDDQQRFFCNVACFERTLPVCFKCHGVLRESYLKDQEDRRFCSDPCLDALRPTCSICTSIIRGDYQRDAFNRIFCSAACLETTLYKCVKCGKSLPQWLEFRGNQYCPSGCLSGALDTYRKEEIQAKTEALDGEVNVLVVGISASGKQTTLSSLFHPVLVPDTEAMHPLIRDLEAFTFGERLRLWLMPGLGTSMVQDRAHTTRIEGLLRARRSPAGREALIDAVIVMADAALRDPATTYRLINQIVLPGIGGGQRVLIGLNQADVALKGEHFDLAKNVPDETLLGFLDQQARTVANRVLQTTRAKVEVIPYAAAAGWNLLPLLDRIIDMIPPKRRQAP